MAGVGGGMGEVVVAVVGPGAVGTALAAAVARSGLGLAPRMFGRSGALAVKARIEGLGEDAYELTLPAASAAELSACALVLVAVKAFDLEAALVGEFVRAVAPGTPVVPLANGDVEDVVRAAAARRPELAWRLGYCTFGVSALEGERSYALRSRQGGAHFGALPGAAGPTEIERSLVAASAGFFVWHDEIVWSQRRKWLYNTALNTLAAARRAPRNGDVLGDVPMLAAVFAEAHALGEAQWGAWPLARDELFKGLVSLIEATSGNENSMARDRRLGRRTESAWLAGRATDAVRYPLLTALHREISTTE